MVSKAVVWTEPQLRFKLGIQESVIDPKVGLLVHGPLDFNSKRRKFSEIRLGLICKEPSRIISFLNKLNSYFPSQKVGDKTYEGFQTIYKVPIQIPSESEVVQLTDQDISRIVGMGNTFEKNRSIV
jgi:hypothetical protein